ncbi:hypothetical protein OG775_08425 [Streptomyces platensis]|uniref:DUF6603 domain-containing protein n=1 Tax=Streptomyces platensis TaxID=58346 RepID=UPI00225875D8|nr:DUF6603 domain-containing protein [Streptomyces platensis]MCX4635166.1 hypothetical protein [Streptomyces platensis]
MPLSVSALRKALEIAQGEGSFQIGPVDLDIPDILDLFRRFLPDGVIDLVSDVAADVDRLSMVGTIRLASQVTSAATVFFLPDEAWEYVVGVRVDIRLPEGEGLPDEVKGIPAALERIGLGALHVVFGAEPKADGGVQGRLGFGADLNFPSSEADPKPYVWGYAPLGSGQQWFVTGSFPDVSLDSLDDLLDFANLRPGDFQLPPDVPSAVALALTGLAIRFVPRQAAQDSRSQAVDFDWLEASMTVSLGTEWDAIPGALKIEALAAEFRVENPLSASPTLVVGVGGRVRLGANVLVDVQVAYPDKTLSGTLTEPFPLASLTGSLPPGMGVPDDAIVSALTVGGDLNPPPARGYSFSATLQNAWRIGGDRIELTGVTLTVSSFGDQAAGEVSAQWRIGVTGTLDVTGTWTSAGWSFRAQGSGIRPADVFAALGITPPAFVADLTIEELLIEFDDQANVTVVLQSTVVLGEKSAALELRIAASGGDTAISGTLELTLPTRPMRFIVQAARGEAGKWLAAKWDAGNEPVDGLDLLSALGLSSPADTPAALLPRFDSLTLWYEPGAKRTALAAVAGYTSWAFAAVDRAFGAAARVGLRAAATQLPMVGDLIPADRDVAMEGVGFALTSASWDEGAAVAANELLAEVEEFGAAAYGRIDTAVLPADLKAPVPASPDGAVTSAMPAFPEQAPLAGLCLTLAYTFGGDEQPPLVLEIWNRRGGADLPARRTRSVDAGRDLDLAIGPLRLKRIALGYTDQRVFLAFDATLQVGPVEFTLLGLGIAVDADLSAPKARPVLSGAALRMDKPPLSIAGAFENRPAPGFSVLLGGSVAVEAKFFAMTALGTYARSRDGWSSVFLFGEAGGVGDVALFGPPAFTVTGLSGGFGVNSDVRLPAVDEVGEFPLVRRLTGSGSPSPQEILELLMGPDAWVRPVSGSYWGAVGVQFTSFKFIQSRALAVVKFGNELAVMLLGRTTVTFPKNAETGRKVQARLNIDLRLGYEGRKGLLSMDVAVADGSFIFHESARLTGGIAVYLWTGGPSPGDFAITAGGYHPSYNVPAHYPRPARMGFIWSPDNSIRVSSQMYTALTPNAIMAGGRLEARYEKGLLSAWFTAYVDALIQWNPFYLEVSIGVRIGVAFTIKVWFVKVRVSIEVGVGIDLWTPPLGGRVSVKVWFVSFSFGFGASRPSLPPQNWQEFRQQLPDPLAITPLAGLLPDIDPAELAARTAAHAPTAITAAGFIVETTSALPASQTYVNDVPFGEGGEAVDIRPMGKLDLTSEHRVIIERNGSEFCWQRYGWKITQIKRDVPSALWGAPGDPGLDEGLIPGHLVGLRIEVPDPSKGDEVGPISTEALGVEPLPEGRMPLRDAAANGPVPAADPTSPRLITDTLAASGVQAKRTAVHEALGRWGYAQPDGALDKYASRAQTTLTDAPLVLPTTMAS